MRFDNSSTGNTKAQARRASPFMFHPVDLYAERIHDHYSHVHKTTDSELQVYHTLSNHNIPPHPIATWRTSASSAPLHSHPYLPTLTCSCSWRPRSSRTVYNEHAYISMIFGQ